MVFLFVLITLVVVVFVAVWAINRSYASDRRWKYNVPEAKRKEVKMDARNADYVTITRKTDL